MPRSRPSSGWAAPKSSAASSLASARADTRRSAWPSTACRKIPAGDEDILRDVLSDLGNEGEDAIGLGFSSAELAKLLKEPDDLEVKEIATGPVDDEFWISLRGPLAQQANALKALQEAMKPFGGVTVEQGTINLG